MDTIKLQVPARSEFVALVRSVVASAAGRLSLPYDEVDDVRLATDEAAGSLVVASSDASAVLEVEVHLSPEMISVTASLDKAPDGWPPEAPEASLTWQILSSLVDETSFETQEGRAMVSFTKKTGDRISA